MLAKQDGRLDGFKSFKLSSKIAPQMHHYHSLYIHTESETESAR